MADAHKPDAQGVVGERLRQIVEKIERLEDERREVADQVKEVMSEAKGEGFDIKVLRQLLKLRRMKPHDRSEQEELLDLYKAAIGML